MDTILSLCSNLHYHGTAGGLINLLYLCWNNVSQHSCKSVEMQWSLSDSVKWSYWHGVFFDVYCLLLCLRLVWKHLLSSNSFPYFCRQEERKKNRLYEARREKVNKNYCIGLPLKSQKQKPGRNLLKSVRQIHVWLNGKARVILLSITVVRISLKSQVAVWKGCECKDASFSLTSPGAETMEISQEMLLPLTWNFS